MKGTMRCPVFSGNGAEYENRRVIVSDWMMIEGKKREYPALEMRSTMRGKALDVVVGLEQQKLLERTGVEMLLRKFEKYYQKESRVYKFSKLKEFYNIRREPEEKRQEYIRRYERVARELKKAGGWRDSRGGEGLASVGASWIRGTRGASGSGGLSYPRWIRPYQGRTDSDIWGQRKERGKKLAGGRKR